MFGGQDNAQAPQNGDNGTQDNTLNGVADLVGGTASPPASDDGAVPVPEHSDTGPQRSNSGGMGSANDELLDLKQKALQQLTPLVGHLEQTPVEKFRTTMMLIQASDNKSLLKEAYEAAQAIEDEKVRAQALLDVVNEINYFTQSDNPQ